MSVIGSATGAAWVHKNQASVPLLEVSSLYSPRPPGPHANGRRSGGATAAPVQPTSVVVSSWLGRKAHQAAGGLWLERRGPKRDLSYNGEPGRTAYRQGHGFGLGCRSSTSVEQPDPLGHLCSRMHVRNLLAGKERGWSAGKEGGLFHSIFSFLFPRPFFSFFKKKKFRVLLPGPFRCL